MAEVSQESRVVGFEASELAANAQGLNVLAALAIPDVMEYLFPPLYLYFWKRCTTLMRGERGFPKFGLGIPRGFAKTIFIKLLVVYLILFTKRKFILVVCASQTLADALISDVIDILDSDNIRKLFGNWDTDLTYDRADSKSFKFRGRHILLKARGQGSAFRGVNEKFARPDVMIFDDSQTKDCAESVLQAREYIEWFRGTAMKAKDPKFCCYLYVGNMYKKTILPSNDPTLPSIYGCQLKNLKNSPYWETIIVGALTVEGKSIWEELQSAEQLIQEYQEDREAGMAEVFLAEVMNDDEAFNASQFDPSRVPDYPYTPEIYPEGRFLVIDPSLGKAKSDDQVVGRCDVIDGHTCVTGLRRIQKSAPLLVEEVLTWCMEEGIPCIAIENYAYQASLGQWFEKYLDDLGIEDISIVLVNRGAQSKNSAILSTLKECMTGPKGEPPQLLLSNEVRPIVYNEIAEFDPIKSDNIDNNLDVLSYMNRVKLEFGQEIQTALLLANLPHPAPAPIDTGMSY